MIIFDQFNLRDPFIFFDETKNLYILTGTTFPEGIANLEPAFHYYLSQDLEEWEGPKVLFQPENDFWGIRNFWAPEIHKFHDKYYLIGSFKGKIGTKRGSLILVSESATGPYKPVSNLPITPLNVDCLDASFANIEGEPWLFYSYEWTNNYYGKIYGQLLSQDLSTTVGEPIEIVNNQFLNWVRPFEDKRVGLSGLLTDAPCYLRFDDQHTLLWSSYGKTELGYTGGYTINITQAKNINGPWSPSKVIFDYNVGHASTFFDRNHQLWICAHNNDTVHGEEHPVIFQLKDIL